MRRGYARVFGDDYQLKNQWEEIYQRAEADPFLCYFEDLAFLVKLIAWGEKLDSTSWKKEKWLLADFIKEVEGKATKDKVKELQKIFEIRANLTAKNWRDLESRFKKWNQENPTLLIRKVTFPVFDKDCLEWYHQVIIGKEDYKKEHYCKYIGTDYQREIVNLISIYQSYVESDFNDYQVFVSRFNAKAKLFKGHLTPKQFYKVPQPSSAWDWLVENLLFILAGAFLLLIGILFLLKRIRAQAGQSKLRKADQLGEQRIRSKKPISDFKAKPNKSTSPSKKEENNAFLQRKVEELETQLHDQQQEIKRYKREQEMDKVSTPPSNIRENKLWKELETLKATLAAQKKTHLNATEEAKHQQEKAINHYKDKTTELEEKITQLESTIKEQGILLALSTIPDNTATPAPQTKKEIPNLSDPKIKEAIPPPAIRYALYPDKDNSFWSHRFSEEAQHNFYELKLYANGRGTYRLIENPDVHRTAAKSASKVLLPACEYENKPFEINTFILTLQEGQLRLEGSQWRIVEKTRIKFL